MSQGALTLEPGVSSRAFHSVQRPHLARCSVRPASSRNRKPVSLQGAGRKSSSAPSPRRSQHLCKGPDRIPDPEGSELPVPRRLSPAPWLPRLGALGKTAMQGLPQSLLICKRPVPRALAPLRSADGLQSDGGSDGGGAPRDLAARGEDGGFSDRGALRGLQRL